MMVNKIPGKLKPTLIGLIAVLTLLSGGGILAATEDLDELIVSISPDQVVGVPLIGNPQVLLFDSLNQPVIGYDLAAFPISLAVDDGILSPSLLNDPASLSGGVISLNSLNIKYSGLSGVHTVTASTDSIVSSGTLISFNGYDILDAFDLTGNEVTTVYSGLPTTLNVAVQNGGSKTAVTDPYVKAFFTSDISGSVKRYFAPAANGQVDTIQFLLENTVLVTGLDTLVLVLKSEYQVGASIYSTEDTTKIPVEVLEAATFAVIPGSITPAAVYSGPSFDLGFEVQTTEFIGPIDSTSLTINLVEFEGGPTIANIYTGAPAVGSFSGGVITYAGLAAAIDSALGVDAGEYVLSFDFRLISGANIFSLSDATPANLTVLGVAAMTYPTENLSPRRVAVSRETQFAFDLNYWSAVNDTSSLILDAAGSSFELIGPSYNASTNLVFEDDTLGNNFVVPGGSLFIARSEKIIVPPAQLGQSLTARASFRYRNSRSGNWLTFAIEFDTEPIEVIEYPVAQLIDLRSNSYNPNRVNSGQEYQLEMRVASKSQADISGLQVKLLSDGMSEFDSIITVPLIPAFETVTVPINVVASGDVGTTETFSAEIMDDSVATIPAIDANATLTIDSPADIVLNCDLSAGAKDSLLERNQSFSLILTYTNQGTASVSPVPFTFSTGGIDLGVDDPSEGTFSDDTNLVFVMTAPDHDTSIILTFDLLADPIDQNTGLAAPIDKTNLIIPLEVASTDAELVMDIKLSNEILLIPGTRLPVLDLELTNTGRSVQTDMILHSIVIHFKNPAGDSVNARDYVVAGESGFYEDGIRLGRAVVGGDRMTFNFDELYLMARESRSLQLILSLQDHLPGPFKIELLDKDIDIRFVDERLSDLPVAVQNVSGDILNYVQQFELSGTSVENSFVIETNPYNPNVGPVRFAYVLDEASAVGFRIYTLTGELVHEQHLAPGEPGTESSVVPHMLSWDGRNDAGQMVLNGVYLAHLELEAKGESYIIKVAVIK